MGRRVFGWKWQADFFPGPYRRCSWRPGNHWQYDTFKARWRDRTVEDAFVSFSLNAKGEIRSLHYERGFAAGGF